MQPLYFSQPNININSGATNPYISKYDSNSILGRMLGTYGNMLKPQDSFNKVLPYETYAAPQREVFNQFVKNTLRPEFERFTLNPFNQNYSDNAAVNNTMYMGNGKDVYQNQLKQTEQPYYNQMEGARNSFENMINQGYLGQQQTYYDNPNAFNANVKQFYQPANLNMLKTAYSLLR